MVEQVQRFDALTECGQQIVQYVDNETAVLKISSQLESFQERWEKLVQQMEMHSKKVRDQAAHSESGQLTQRVGSSFREWAPHSESGQLIQRVGSSFREDAAHSESGQLIQRVGSLFRE
jgi:hypothetical protein